jgi:ribose transport system permease protein
MPPSHHHPDHAPAVTETTAPAAEHPPRDLPIASTRGTIPRLPSGLGPRLSLVGLWLLMAAVYAIIEPHTFLQSGTAQTIFGSQVELVFLALALICTFVVGEFDLSVASVMGLAATLVPLLVVDHQWNPFAATLVAFLAATAVGALNGFLVVVVGVDAIVATLGMATFVIGITLALTNLEAVQGLSSGYSDFALANALGLPISFFYGLVASLLLAYVLVFTPLGLRMSFVGAGHEVARLAGVNVRRIRFGSYVASGAICGVAGIIVTASLGGYDPNISSTYLLPAFAAVFLGTAVIQPGKFNPIGTLIGVYFLQTGIVGLQLAGLTGWVNQVFYGGTLVLAVAVTTLIQRRAARRPAHA